jgi:hypothetical protein
VASQALRLADPRPTPVLPHVGFSPLRLTEGATSTGDIPPVSIHSSVLRASMDETKVGRPRRRILSKDEPATQQALAHFLQRSSLRPVLLSDHQRLSTSPTCSESIICAQMTSGTFEAAPGTRVVPHFHRCFLRPCHSLFRTGPTGCLHSALHPQYCLREVSPSLGALIEISGIRSRCNLIVR